MIFLGRNSSNTGVLLILYFFTHVQERNEIYFFNKRVLSVDFACALQSTGFLFEPLALQVNYTYQTHTSLCPTWVVQLKIKCHQFSSGLRK